jgi:hypothetical protein
MGGAVPVVYGEGGCGQHGHRQHVQHGVAPRPLSATFMSTVKKNMFHQMIRITRIKNVRIHEDAGLLPCFMTFFPAALLPKMLSRNITYFLMTSQATRNNI